MGTCPGMVVGVGAAFVIEGSEMEKGGIACAVIVLSKDCDGPGGSGFLLWRFIVVV